MTPKLQALLAGMALLQPGLANVFGGAFSTGPVNKGNFIRKAWSTLIVPEAPTPVKGTLSLWTGMGTSNGDLVQALCESFVPDPNKVVAPCYNLGGDYCARTYTLKGSTGQAEEGRLQQLKPGTRLTQYYEFNDKRGTYDQYALVNGRRISFLRTESGRALGFGTAEECLEDTCGVVPQHQWVDTNIILDKKFSSYGKTMGVGNAN